MKRASRALVRAAALLVTCLAISSAAAESGAQRPKVGDVFPLQEGTFKGWTLVGASEGREAYALFFKDGAYLIALTRPADRHPRGGARTYKIVRTELPRQRSNETVLDEVICSPDGHRAPIIAFHDAGSGLVRGIFAAPGGLIIQRWHQNINDCTVPGE